MTFQEEILAGIPAGLPEPKPYDKEIIHAPKRKDILTEEQKVLALKNASAEKVTRHSITKAESTDEVPTFIPPVTFFICKSPVSYPQYTWLRKAYRSP